MKCRTLTHFVTRLRIDGVEEYHFRAITGNTIYHTNTVGGYVSLSGGKHEIKVEYRTPGVCSGSATDWNVASLQITQ